MWWLSNRGTSALTSATPSTLHAEEAGLVSSKVGSGVCCGAKTPSARSDLASPTLDFCSASLFFSLGQTKGVYLWAQCARVKQVSAYTSMMHFPSSCGIHAARFCLSVTAFSTTAQQRHPAR